MRWLSHWSKKRIFHDGLVALGILFEKDVADQDHSGSQHKPQSLAVRCKEILDEDLVSHMNYRIVFRFWFMCRNAQKLPA